MPQPKQSRSSAARKPAAKKPAAKKPAAKKPAAAKRTSTTRKPSTAAKSAPKTFEETPAASSAAERDDQLRQSLGQLRELLAGGIILTPQRLQETLDDAVSRGRMVRKDAEDLTRSLVGESRRQTQELLNDVESALKGGAKQVKKSASKRGDAVLATADKVRRRAGAPPSFPILGYDDLTAAQVTGRIGDLTPAELRKVRDYEKRNANRKSVLNAVEKALA